MSKKMDDAENLFRSGFNCSQSVLGVFADNYGLQQKDALKLACGFGGGMRNGEICGAVSGTVMVIGLKYGQSVNEDIVSKNNCYEKTVEFTNLFKQEHHSIICKDLLCCDISTETGMASAKERGLFTTTCVDLIRSAVHMLETLGY
jgi:C_GCAxxG_C_C family probable redox protein